MPSIALRPRTHQGRPSLPAGERRLRVMHVVTSLDPGGTERLVIEIAKSLIDDAQPAVCCLDTEGKWAAELTDLQIPVAALNRREGFQPGVGRRIARLADEHQIDVLHCHHYSPFVYGQIAALHRRHLRVVFTEHGRLSDRGPSLKRRLVNPLLGRMPARIFAVSHDLRKYMIAEGLPSDRVQVIHNGIDPGKRPSSIARAAARLALGIPQDAYVVGTAGRLDPVKDLVSLVDATATLAQTHPRVRLVMIGDGPERAALESRIDAFGARGLAVLTGYREDVRQLLPAFDVYANTSTHEGISLTILEAMAAELPVVATSVGGTPEVIVDQKTGFLVPARGVVQIAGALSFLSRSPDLRREAGRAGRLRVERHFSISAMTQAYLQAYRGSLED